MIEDPSSPAPSDASTAPTTKTSPPAPQTTVRQQLLRVCERMSECTLGTDVARCHSALRNESAKKPKSITLRARKGRGGWIEACRVN